MAACGAVRDQSDWMADMKRRQIDGDALLADARALLARSAATRRRDAPRERTAQVVMRRALRAAAWPVRAGAAASCCCWSQRRPLFRSVGAGCWRQPVARRRRTGAAGHRQRACALSAVLPAARQPSDRRHLHRARAPRCIARLERRRAWLAAACSACWRCAPAAGSSTCTAPAKHRWCSVCRCGSRTRPMVPSLCLAALHRAARHGSLQRAGRMMRPGAPLLLFAAMLALMALARADLGGDVLPRRDRIMQCCRARTRLLAYLKGMAFARFSIYDLSVIPLFLLMGQLATQGGLSRALFRAATSFRRPLARGTGAGGGAGERGIRCGLRLVGSDGGDDCPGGAARDATVPLRRRLRGGDAGGGRNARHPDSAVGGAGALRDHRRAEHRQAVRRGTAARRARRGAVLRRDRAADAAGGRRSVRPNRACPGASDGRTLAGVVAGAGDLRHGAGRHLRRRVHRHRGRRHRRGADRHGRRCCAAN